MPEDTSAQQDRLPVDPDVEVDDLRTMRPARPVHLTPAHIATVVIGGAFGTAARELLAWAIPAPAGFPLGILIINISGAFALGVLLEVLLRLGPDEGRRRFLRLLLGTGFMGGYTTYSTLAVGTAQALTSGAVTLAVAYALGNVVLGAVAGFAGIAVGARIHSRVVR